MMNKQAKVARRLLLIGGIWYLVGAALFFVVGMITPIDININGVHTRAYLWEFFTYPGPLSLWLGMILVPLILGVIGFIFRKKIKTQPTNAQGTFLLVAGIVTVLTGAGILYIIAGVQTMLASTANSVAVEENQ